MDSLVETYSSRNQAIPADIDEKKQAIGSERDALTAKVSYISLLDILIMSILRLTLLSKFWNLKMSRSLWKTLVTVTEIRAFLNTCRRNMM